MFGGACGMVGGRATVGLDVDPLARVEGPTAECVVELGFVATLSLLCLSSPLAVWQQYPVHVGFATRSCDAFGGRPAVSGKCPHLYTHTHTQSHENP